jgi:acetolactate synthase I/II/III large subunit
MNGGAAKTRRAGQENFMQAAHIIVRSMAAHGVVRAYCVPGESYLALLDALHGSVVEVVVCRHEGGAGFMACAEAKLTNKPSVCMVSRGPGATNASIAVHMAEQDALPVIFLIGQVARDERTRGVFQEVDYSHFFGSMAKGVFEVTDGEKLHEIMPRAFRLASEGTPGPVVISLPEDMLRDTVADQQPLVFPPATVRHSAKDIQRIQDYIDHAERPVAIAGGVLRSKDGVEALRRFGAAQRIPIGVSWKNQDVFDNGSDLYAGHIGFGTPAAFKQILAESDLILAFGTRLGDVASLGHTFPKAPDPDQALVHVYPDSRPLGKNCRTDFPLVADPAQVLMDLAHSARVVSSVREAWTSRINGFIRSFQAFKSVEPTDGVDFGSVVTSIARQAAADCVVTTDAGNMSTWVHRHWVMTPKNTLLGAIVGAMGFGVPAAVASSLAQPNRQAICFVGDGGVLMTGQELATAMAYGAAPKVVISDNGIYGTIRTHQEREYPGRVSGTMLTNPDFTAWAQSFGAAAFRLELGGDVDGTVAAFLAEKGAAVLHVKSSRQALSAYGQIKG